MRVCPLVVLFALITGCAQPRTVIESVIVLDASFQEVTRLTDHEALRGFEQLWRAKNEVKATGISFEFKLDLQFRGESVRWLYTRDGYARVLSSKSTPLYQVEDAESLNLLLGIESGSGS